MKNHFVLNIPQFIFTWLTWSIAAIEPAATPVAVNPIPAKTTGEITTAATSVPTAARVLPDTGHSDKKKN